MTTNKEFGRIKLSDFHGIISKETGEALEKSIKESRKKHREMRKKRSEALITRNKKHFEKIEGLKIQLY